MTNGDFITTHKLKNKLNMFQKLYIVEIWYNVYKYQNKVNNFSLYP